jgi:uncharacterized membrane protein
MRRIWLIYSLHVMALIFGLSGILIALPNPELWIDSAYGPEIFRFGINYGGIVHILWGALAMLAFGGLTIGWRKTLIFAAAAASISLSSELIGTTTGFPFGDYAYLNGLGTKVLGRVPFTIPLSWFYLGFASYLLANAFIGPARSLKRSVLAILGGTYLLVVWDLVLDPAMAHESMPIRFWTWYDTGSYYGMPWVNFLGWAGTGALFMVVARLFWRKDADPDTYSPALPYAIYLANVVFGVVLAINVGLWVPAILAIVLGVVPVTVLLSRKLGEPGRRESSIAYAVMKRGASLTQRQIDLTVDGSENLPASGATLIVARHFHHFHDGSLLVANSPRPVRIMVGLDWVQQRPMRSLIEFACHSVSWPIVLRRDGPALADSSSVYEPNEMISYLRSAVRESLNLLRSGEVLVVFPEAYPNIDPAGSRKPEESDFLPFSASFARLARMAERDGITKVSIVPVGFVYEMDRPNAGKWNVTMRFGAAIELSAGESTEDLVRRVESDVRMLSRPSEIVSQVSERELVTS